jgi:hypothetical protein
MSNNIQILNYNHNVISLSNGNTIVITDNIKGNSITIPQPVTSILQINSPGPQGPAGTGGGGIINTGSFATTGSNTFRGNQIITGSVNISGSLNINNNNADTNTAQFGTIGIQSYTVNNAWFGDNAYFNGSQFVRRQTGYSGLFYFQGNEGQFRFGDNDTSGSSITNGSGFGKVTLKTNLDGTFAIGDLSYASANYTGAKLIVDSTGKTGINTTTPHSDLEVNGAIGLQYKYVDLTATGNYVIADNTPATVYRFSNTTATNYSIELPNASTYPNRTYWISRGADNSGNAITINCGSNIEYRDGTFSTSISLNDNTRYQWISDGTQWVLIMYNVG